VSKIKILLDTEPLVNCSYCDEISPEEDMTQLNENNEWKLMCSKCADKYYKYWFMIKAKETA